MAFERWWWAAASMILAAGLAGCYAWRHPVVPSLVHVQVEAPRVQCGGDPHAVLVKVHVRNDSRSNLRLSVEDVPGPPYQLSWFSYDVLSSSGQVEWRQSGGHGPLVQKTLVMEPGDRTVVSAPVYDIGEAEYGRSYRIKFEDGDGHAWTTEAFPPCVRESQ